MPGLFDEVAVNPSQVRQNRQQGNLGGAIDLAAKAAQADIGSIGAITAGNLFGNALENATGFQSEDEKQAQAVQSVAQRVQQEGLSLDKDPQKFIGRTSELFLQIGRPDLAMKAVEKGIEMRTKAAQAGVGEANQVQEEAEAARIDERIDAEVEGLRAGNRLTGAQEKSVTAGIEQANKRLENERAQLRISLKGAITAERKVEIEERMEQVNKELKQGQVALTSANTQVAVASIEQANERLRLEGQKLIDQIRRTDNDANRVGLERRVVEIREKVAANNAVLTAAQARNVNVKTDFIPKEFDLNEQGQFFNQGITLRDQANKDIETQLAIVAQGDSSRAASSRLLVDRAQIGSINASAARELANIEHDNERIEQQQQQIDIQKRSQINDDARLALLQQESVLDQKLKANQIKRGEVLIKTDIKKFGFLDEQLSIEQRDSLTRRMSAVAATKGVDIRNVLANYEATLSTARAKYLRAQTSSLRLTGGVPASRNRPITEDNVEAMTQFVTENESLTDLVAPTARGIVARIFNKDDSSTKMYNLARGMATLSETIQSQRKLGKGMADSQASAWVIENKDLITGPDGTIDVQKLTDGIAIAEAQLSRSQRLVGDDPTNSILSPGTAGAVDDVDFKF